MNYDNLRKASDEIQEILDKYDMEMSVLTMRQEDVKMMANIMSVGVQVIEDAEGKVDKQKQLMCLEEYILPLMDKI